MGLTAAQKPQVFFPETPDKPQLAERLLTKNQDNGAPLHLSSSTLTWLYFLRRKTQQEQNS